jgi:cyclopropane fatty-acyl-phospholipid synthase-like methyltransferase
LGAGSGWMSEFLAVMKFKAIATTISHNSIKQIESRISSLKQKEFPVTLQCYETPMESVAEFFKNKNVLPFDAVFVFEALHHAYDWQKSLKSAFDCLDRGGWLIICNEPNLVHTFVSYRIAKLSNTHEIGMSKLSLMKTLKQIGFRKVVCLNNRLHLLIKPHWIAAQK